MVYTTGCVCCNDPKSLVRKKLPISSARRVLQCPHKKNKYFSNFRCIKRRDDKHQNVLSTIGITIKESLGSPHSRGWVTWTPQVSWGAYVCGLQDWLNYQCQLGVVHLSMRSALSMTLFQDGGQDYQ